MRIPSRVYNQAAGQLTGRQDQPAPQEEVDAVAKAPSVEDVRVAVSGKAKKLAVASSMDAAKVARLRAAIEAGAFSIDSARIADAIAQSGG